MAQSTITITFGERVENHVGMRQLGEEAEDGFSVEELGAIAAQLAALHVDCELISLDIEDVEHEPACVLVIRNGVCEILGDDSAADGLQAEQAALEVDKKAFMKGRVVNKIARHNLCFGDGSQEPNYAAGQGRVVNFSDVPLLETLRIVLPEWLGEKAAGLLAEGNYYYDLSKTYIGPHGDSERKRVVGVRLGDDMPLWYHWYHRFGPVGPTFKIDLHHGDLYVMSEKAVGTDWKKSSVPTLRHAAGLEESLKRAKSWKWGA